MSTIEEATPLLFPGPFFLPVIYPAKVGTIPNLYYDQLANQGVAVSVTPSTPTGPFEIRVDGIGYTETRTRKRRKKVTPLTIKAEEVYALTAGFASYEQSTKKVVLRLWAGDVDNLVKSADVRPNRIVYGSLDSSSVASNFATYIGELPKAVLQESWAQTNTGIPPTSNAVLEVALLNRFLQGDAMIYVEAGAVLGTGIKSGNSMTLTVECFFDPDDPDNPAAPQAPTVPVPVEDVIDNAQQPGRIIRYAGHPLVQAAGALVITVHFKSKFLIWNNATFAYEPFANQKVTLLATPPVPLVPDDLLPKIEIKVDVPTDSAGYVDFSAPLPSRATLRFRYATTGLKVGNRTFNSDIETDPHKARAHVDANFINDHEYRAKYEIYPRYQAFIDDIAAQGDGEVLEKDRGNANEFDKSRPTDLLSFATLVEVLEVFLPDKLEPRIAFSQHELQAQIAACEAFYKRAVIPDQSETFNLLVEGDSWTNYPLAFNDLYSHLDEILQRKLRDGKSYNRIPLQHFGDRADQMFVTIPGVTRQFDFTRDFLDEYPVDLILCSAGGNDFAEPGISGDFDVEPFKTYINHDTGYFDPYAAAAPGGLSTAQLASAKALMEISFAVLLKNHPWNFFLQGVSASQLPLQQKDAATLRAELDPLIASIGDGDFGPTPERIEKIRQTIDQLGVGIDPQLIPDPQIRHFYETAAEMTREAVWEAAYRAILQEIGGKVIAKFPEDPATVPAAAQLLETVFDIGTVTDFAGKRYAVIEERWRLLLDEAKQRGIPVISHAYGYPLFNESQTSYLGQGKWHITGPWFTHRFAQANVTDLRVQKMCLKAFLDHIKLHVFDTLRDEYTDAVFDFVDTRNENSLVTLWRDELHLKSPGYRKNAEKVFAKVQKRWPAFFEEP